MTAARFVRILGRRTLTLGAVLIAISDACLALITYGRGGLNFPLYEVCMAVAGAGIGMVGAPLLSQVLAGVDAPSAGSASGVLSTTQQTAGALGVAVVGIIFFGVRGRANTAEAYGHAFAASLVYLVALAVLVVVITLPGRWWRSPGGDSPAPGVARAK
jgi:hypothetical protein